MSDKFIDDRSEGWAVAFLHHPPSRKAHYFAPSEDNPSIWGVSLCGKYRNLGYTLEPDDGTTSPDDCKECRRRLDARTHTNTRNSNKDT